MQYYEPPFWMAEGMALRHVLQGEELRMEMFVASSEEEPGGH